MSEPLTTTNPNPKTAPSSRLVSLLLAVAAVVHLAFVSVNFSSPVLEGHSFRQAQTALTTYWFQQDGWQLPPPLPLFGPPWSAPMEFPLFQAVAATVASVTDGPLDPTGRATSLFFFYLTLPGLALLAHRLPLPRAHRWLLPTVALVTPIHLFYARAFGIESLALCCAVWFLWGYDRLEQKPGWGMAGLTAVLGCLAALSKITTFLVFLVPALILTWPRLQKFVFTRDRAQFQPLVMMATSAFIGIGAGYLWVVYGDGIKASNPFSTFLVSSQMKDWNYGPLSLRFTGAFWHNVLHNLHHHVLSLGNFLLAAVLILTGSASHRRAALALTGCFLAGPLAFANLYAVHNYYYFANTVFALAVLAIAWSRLLQTAVEGRRWGFAAVGLSLALQMFGFYGGLFQEQRDHGYEIPRAATWIKSTTDPDEVVVVWGEDWNPVLPYYAERRFVMLSARHAGDLEAIDEVVSRLQPATPAAFVITAPKNPTSEYEEFLAQKFGLSDWPALQQGPVRMYLTAERAKSLASGPPAEVAGDWTWRDAWESGIPGLEMQTVDWQSLPDLRLLEICHPLPTSVRAAFGISAAKAWGQPAINAHAPTTLVYEQPEGWSRARLEFGVAEGAYTGEEVTDGVLFRLEFQSRDRPGRMTLWERLLDPAKIESDRGRQTWEGSFDSLGPGTLYVHVLAGVATNLTLDWGLLLNVSLD